METPNQEPATEPEYNAEATSFDALEPATQALLEGVSSSSENPPPSEPAPTDQPAEAQAEGAGADAIEEAKPAESDGEPAGEEAPAGEVKATDLELFQKLVRSEEQNVELRQKAKGSDRLQELQDLGKTDVLGAIRGFLGTIEGIDPKDAEIDLLGLLTDEALGVESTEHSSSPKISRLEAELQETKRALEEFRNEQKQRDEQAAKARDEQRQYQAAISEVRKELDAKRDEYADLYRGVEMFHALDQHTNQSVEDVVVEAMQHLIKSGETDVTISKAANWAASQFQPHLSKLKTLLAPTGDTANQTVGSNQRVKEPGPRTLTNADATRVPDGKVPEYIEDDEESKLQALSMLKWD